PSQGRCHPLSRTQCTRGCALEFLSRLNQGRTPDLIVTTTLENVVLRTWVTQAGRFLPMVVWSPTLGARPRRSRPTRGLRSVAARQVGAVLRPAGRHRGRLGILGSAPTRRATDSSKSLGRRDAA